MNNQNIFVVGQDVSGNSQIGYERYLKKFTRILLNSVNSISIIGAKQFGKTSLAKETLFRVKQLGTDKRTITMFINLGMMMSYSDMLSEIVNQLDQEVNNNNQGPFLYGKFKKKKEELEQTDRESTQFRTRLSDLLKFLKDNGYRIILAIDEFDAASEREPVLFTRSADFEFLRNLSSGSVGVSLILISRRRVNVIEKKNCMNSTLDGAVQTEPLSGYNEEDFLAYYNVLKERYGIILNEYSTERLKYYCGRSPYLLSMFAYDMVTETENRHEIDIDKIYEERQIDIQRYYNTIYKCLKNDKIEEDGVVEKRSTIEKLLGIIVGPQINITKEDIPLLENMGYLYTFEGKYYSISIHFTNYLRKIPIEVDTWKAILDLEKIIKSMIRKQVMLGKGIEHIDYDTWRDIFETAGSTAATLDTYDRFIRDSMQEYKCDVDLLEVCSLNVAVDILKYNWDKWFSQFFSHDEWGKWEPKLRMCAKARNPMAHGHTEFISAEDRSHVNEYCKSITKLLSDKNVNMNIKTELELERNIKKVEVRRRYYSQEYANVGESMKGKSVKFTAADQTRNAILGFFEYDGKCYKASIENSKWTRYSGGSLSRHLGSEFNAIVGYPQNRQNTFELYFSR